MAPGLKRFRGLLRLRLNSARKCCTRRGMSLIRSRKGGTLMGMTLRR